MSCLSTPRTAASIISFDLVHCLSMPFLFGAHRTVILFLITVTTEIELDGSHILLMNTLFPSDTEIILILGSLLITQRQGL